MSTFDGNNFYFSGQGVVMIGDRDSVTGKPKGFVPVGNVSSLKLGLASTVVEHKESQSGARAIDLRLTTELKSSLSMTVENFQSNALATALAGTWAKNTGKSITAETGKLWMGKVIGLINIKVSSVVVKQGATALTKYSDSSTPWDYLLNADAGSIKFNDGTGGLRVDKLTTLSAVTAPNSVTASTAAGLPTTFGWSASVPVSVQDAGVGGYMVVSGLAGADAAVVNNIPGVITAIDLTAKTVKVDIDSFGKTITLGTPLVASDGLAITVDYDFATYNRVEALNQTAAEKYMRFEGLNTADEGNPVIVEVYRFITDPLKELALIGEGVVPFQLDGNTLYDPLQLTGSKFFNVRHLR